MFVLHFDVCAIIILAILLVSLILRKTTVGRTYRLLILMFVLMIVGAVGDMMSCLGADYFVYSHSNRAWMNAFNYIYFFSHGALLPILLLYIGSNMGIWHILKGNKFIKNTGIILFAVNMLILISNPFTKAIFYIDDNLQYVRGQFLFSLYIIAIVFALFGLNIIIKYRKLLDRAKLIVLICIYVIAAIGVIIQIFTPYVPVEMFSYSIIAILFIVVVQGKEENINPIVGAKKYSEGLFHMKNLLLTEAPSIEIFFKINNWMNIQLQLGLGNYNQFLLMQSKSLNAAFKRLRVEAELYYMEQGLYGIILESVSYDSAMRLAKLINNNYQSPIIMDGIEVTVDARVCIVSSPEEIKDYSTMFTMATTFHRTMPYSGEVLKFSDYASDADFMLRTELGDIIERAIENNTLSVHYQPIYSVGENRFTGAEALVRLYDEKYGNVSPALFIPVAERNGSIRKIADFVFDEVCRFIRDNDISEKGLKCISINLSAAQCMEEDLVDKVERTVRKYDIKYNQIMFEITESDEGLDSAVGDRNIVELHDKGIKFAIDSYGNGYSNIEHIAALPFELVKLDKSFMDEMNDDTMWVVVQDTITMLKEMNKEVLAEGIEQEDTASRIKDLGFDYLQGCEFMQGFYFCRPLPEKEFIDFINSIN